MEGVEKMFVCLGALLVILGISMGILDTIDKQTMTSQGYEQSYEPVTKTKYWVKVQ